MAVIFIFILVLNENVTPVREEARSGFESEYGKTLVGISSVMVCYCYCLLRYDITLL